MKNKNKLTAFFLVFKTLPPTGDPTIYTQLPYN